MNRTLHYAIALSIALHGVILFGLSLERSAAPREVPRPPLEAKLVEPAPPPVAAAPVPQPEPVKPPPAPPKPKAQPKPRPVAKSRPVPKPVPVEPVEPPSAATPEKPVPAAPAPEPPAAPAIAKAEPQPAPAAPPGPSAEQLEAQTREQYRLQILDAARGHNRYPPLARENNWEGQVLVRLEIAADGRVSLAVARSSGHPVLDRQALDMFRRAQAQVPLPASLRGKALNLELRAIYNLRDQVSG